MEVVNDGDIAHYNFERQKKTMKILIRCSCGGNSEVYVLCCKMPGSQNDIYGQCRECEKSLFATIDLFFA